MNRLAFAILALLIAPLAAAQATARPTIPVVAWDQPLDHLPMLVKLGVTHALGPEVPNAKNLAPDALAAGKLAWIKGTLDNKLKSILRNPTGPLPSNCVGLMLATDEANGKGIPPTALAAESNDLRARYPGVPIFISLAGDKVTSNLNPANRDYATQVQLYKDYAALADIITVDAYSANRNASRYKTTWTGDAVKILRAVTGKPVWAWIECTDQVLPAPTSKSNGVDLDINREPTPDEMQAIVDNCLQNGATGIGWFPTCDSGKYGWTWDAKRGDSYWPLVNRFGVSTQPQLDAVERISKTLAPPAPDPVQVLQAKINELEQNQRAASDALDTLTRLRQQDKAEQDAKWQRLIDAVRGPATTQPSTQPTGGT